MAVTSYEYSIAADFPGVAVDEARLVAEIDSAAITVKLSNLSASGDAVHIAFQAPLSAGELTILAGVLAAHDGVIAVVIEASTRVSIEKPESDEKWFHTVNWCDRCTWWQRSILVEDEELQEIGNPDNSKYSLDKEFIVCLNQGKLTMEDLIPDTYKLHVYVDGVLQAEQLTYVHETMLEKYKGDYECDHRAGEIRFHAPIAEGAVVTATYRYAVDSTFTMAPEDGKALKIQAAEAEFTTGFDMRDTVVYQAFLYAAVVAGAAGIPLATLQAGLIAQYGGTRDSLMLFLGYVDGNGAPLQRDLEPYDKVPHPTQVRIYKTYWDFRTQSNGNHAVVPRVGGPKRGTRSESITHPFDYRTNKNLDPAIGLEARIWLKDHVEFGKEANSTATATFYCISED